MGSQPSPPTLDTAQSKALTQADYDLKIQNTPQMVAATGRAGREEYARNLGFALQGFSDPKSLVYGAQSRELQEKVDGADARLRALQNAEFDATGPKGTGIRKDPETGKWLSPSAYNKRIEQLKRQRTDFSSQLSKIKNADPVADLQRAFKDEFKMRDNLLGDMRAAERSSAEYERMQRALGRGVTAQQASMERVQAQETGESALGKSLMSEAMKKVAQGGALSPEASRDAVQAARSGMAARGLATGGAGMAAELLNRDQYARAREFQNLGFAQNVEAADLARRTGNTANRQQAGMQNAQAFNQLSQFNTGMRADTDRFNMGLLQTSAQAADNERARQLGLGQTAYNFALQTNPKMMLAGLGSPYANFTPQALGLMGNQNVQPIYSGGSFSSGGTGSMIAGGLGGAMSGAAAGSALGPWGAGIGGVVGLGAGLLSSRS